jgi:hypothetical protein
MSKIMENKQIIHIASEIVAFASLIYYFNQKNKKLLSHIQDLSQKMEEQAELLQKHEEVITKMTVFINQQKINSTLNLSSETDSFNKKEQSKNRKKEPIKVVKSEPIKVSFKEDLPKQNNIIQRIEEISSESESESESGSESESDLDLELSEELKELEIEKPSLKK